MRNKTIDVKEDSTYEMESKEPRRELQKDKLLEKEAQEPEASPTRSLSIFSKLGRKLYDKDFTIN